MHPAPSIILFTVLSGLGFGLLFFLGLGMPAVTGGVAWVFFLMAFALAGLGLVFSTFHLGHPERALKAFSQWRSSWLSREGVAAVAALGSAGLFAMLILFADTRVAVLGLLTSGLAVTTIFTTSMIYAQLRAVPHWHHWSTSALFLGYGLGGGALLAGQISVAVPIFLGLGLLQLWTWQYGNVAFARGATTLGSATGLGRKGRVRAFEAPHTGTNYLLDEMVYRIGRRHSLKLRMIGFSLAILLPLMVLTVLPFHHALAGLAVLGHIAGMLVIRWLFFAEARHVVGLYYGK